MKKTIKVMGLLFAIAALFSGCSSPVKEKSETENQNTNQTTIPEKLFESSEVTEDFTWNDSFTLSDGSWTMLTWSSSPEITTAIKYEFTNDAGSLTPSEVTYYAPTYTRDMTNSFKTTLTMTYLKEQGFTKSNAQKTKFYSIATENQVTVKQYLMKN